MRRRFGGDVVVLTTTTLVALDAERGVAPLWKPVPSIATDLPPPKVPAAGVTDVT
jgi:hypothetical protein